jgi:hypothetical protein
MRERITRREKERERERRGGRASEGEKIRSSRANIAGAFPEIYDV